ncbi:MAG: DNA cytosine methyltransferase [Micropepsaceae bacterium]
MRISKIFPSHAKPPTILDLFSGCGGFALGSRWAGFETALAIDIDPILSGPFGLNYPSVPVSTLDIRDLTARSLRILQPQGVDGVIGGPPCQAFSAIGRREPNDPRRMLVHEFFRIVSIVRPKFFIFENVRGLGFEKNISVLTEGLNQLKGRWNIVGPIFVDASDFGAPTKRIRLFVFGFDSDRMSVPSVKALAAKSRSSVNVRDAISDLGGATENAPDASGFDVWRYGRVRNISKYGSSMRSRSGRFTGHRRTVHSPKTIMRFEEVPPGGVDPVGKYHRLKWDGVCPTLRAGTGSDKGSYQAVRPLHPTENRVITAREAARLQGFPDDFLFHPTIWHSCRMIGNSVSPIVARVLLQRIRGHLG